MKPKIIEWSIGNDIHGRPVSLRQDDTTPGKTSFSIISEAVNQRDEGERIFSLSGVNLLAIREITKDWR